MIQPGFLDPESRQDLTELARDGLAAHRLARRANALVLLDQGMGYATVAKVLLLDDDTVRTWHRLHEGVATRFVQNCTLRRDASESPPLNEGFGCRLPLNAILKEGFERENPGI